MENHVFTVKLNKEVLEGDDISYLELCRNPNLTQEQRERLKKARKLMLQKKVNFKKN
ncbi:hypothetical protein K9M42_00115 [Patescibacteria group bacterium]|nr:hypothetical protein [Patescibacteria group bacterium]